MKHYLIISILLFFIPSCAHVISRENLDTSISGMPFRELQGHIDENVGKKFIFGGIIAETINTRGGAEIEVVQTPIDRWGNVIARDISDGRFIVKSKRNLDPLIFRAGREITIAGALTGTQKKMLGETDYNYPVFETAEVSLRPDELYYSYPIWREPLYVPYPYYWYDPFWQRPFFYPH